MTLYEIMREVARNLADVREGTATGGSTTTLIDTLLVGEPDDHFNNGLIFLDLATPVIKQISDYAGTTSTFTWVGATSPAVAAAVKYCALTSEFNIESLKNAVNQAMRNEIGKVMMIDETTTVVAEQIEYDLPTGVTDIRRIETGDSTDGWTIHRGWREEGAHLQFINDIPTEGSIKIHYAAVPAELTALTDAINTGIDRQYLVAAATFYASQWRKNRANGSEQNNKDNYSMYMSEMARMRMANTKRLMPKDANLGVY